MIPDEAVEAATRVVWEMADSLQSHEYAEEIARKALEAAAPHLIQPSPDDLEEIETQVKEIVQEVAMTVDYTARLYDAVQKIMAVTLGKGLTQ